MKNQWDFAFIVLGKEERGYAKLDFYYLN